MSMFVRVEIDDDAGARRDKALALSGAAQRLAVASPLQNQSVFICVNLWLER